MKEADFRRVEHIGDHCKDIQNALRRLSSDYAAFAEDKDIRTAIVMYIAQIGEISGGLSDEFKQNEGAAFPWGMIKSMRNLIVHAYHRVDIDMIWETAAQDVPKLSAFCEKVISENTF